MVLNVASVTCHPHPIGTITHTKYHLVYQHAVTWMLLLASCGHALSRNIIACARQRPINPVPGSFDRLIEQRRRRKEEKAEGVWPLNPGQGLRHGPHAGQLGGSIMAIVCFADCHQLQDRPASLNGKGEPKAENEKGDATGRVSGTLCADHLFWLHVAMGRNAAKGRGKCQLVIGWLLAWTGQHP
jgi:hypothetical protein